MISSIPLMTEIKLQLIRKDWRYADLAAATGYSLKTVQTYMCKASEKQSEKFETKVKAVLEISDV